MTVLDIEFTVDMMPAGKARPRMGKFGMYTPKKTQDAERMIAVIAKAAMRGRPPTTHPVTMMVSVTFPIPVSYRGAKRSGAESGQLLPAKKIDIDNSVKLVADALNAIVYIDDAQVCRLVAEKKYGQKAQLWIRVFDLVPDES